MNQDLSPTVLQFITDHIDSVAELEALLLTRREQVAWTAVTLANRLYVSDKQGAEILAALARQGFLEVTTESGSPSYKYAPRVQGMDETVEKVADLYSKYLIPITNHIHSKTKSSVQHFADAFRLREEPK